FTDCLSATPGCEDTNQYHYAPAASRRGDRYADIGVTNVWGADHTSTALVIRSAVGVATATTPGAPGAGCSFPGLDVSGDLSPDELTRATLPLSGPSWSPDGRSVVYALRGASGWAVFRIDVPADTADCDAYDGANIAAGGSQPQWSPAPLAAVVATPKAPKGWHLKRVTSKRVLDKTLHAKKSADVRLPKKYIGGLLQVTTRAATKRTKLSVCAKPAHGTAAGTRCAKVVAKKRATRTVSVIATAGAGHHVRVRNAKGKVRVTVTVLGYYRR
ncbi:MAG TPA: hypothetical protein VFN19_06560, partial [Candidatus Nanopelagicales bacterium]|nr:hypothetical protein [Candidatus Nanopelagicales bacterium]